MALKQFIGRKLIDFGIKLAGIPIEEEPRKQIDHIKGQPHSAVVEADDTPQNWTPEQHGNVIIAEPDVMRAFRRNNGNL